MSDNNFREFYTVRLFYYWIHPLLFNFEMQLLYSLCRETRSVVSRY